MRIKMDTIGTFTVAMIVMTAMQALDQQSRTWYDGADRACDGLSDYDADYDGQDAQGYGGMTAMKATLVFI